MREFKDDVHNQTQIEFLNSIKSQTYQNYELIITEFYEEELYSQLEKLKIKFKLVKSKLLSELSELDAKYSHWEFIDNVYPFKKDQNIVISTLSDSIFEKIFFKV